MSTEQRIKQEHEWLDGKMTMSHVTERMRTVAHAMRTEKCVLLADGSEVDIHSLAPHEYLEVYADHLQSTFTQTREALAQMVMDLAYRIPFNTLGIRDFVEQLAYIVSSGLLDPSTFPHPCTFDFTGFEQPMYSNRQVEVIKSQSFRDGFEKGFAAAFK